MAAAATRNWRLDAACAGSDPEVWFALSTPGQEYAAWLCRHSCQVIDQCRQWADDMGLVDGVWGGETEQQRRTRLAGRPDLAGQVAVCDDCGHGFLRRRPEQRFCDHACHGRSMAATRTGLPRVRAAECGTAAAARRHRKHGEPVDDACRMAESLYRARRRAEAAHQTAAVAS